MKCGRRVNNKSLSLCLQNYKNKMKTHFTSELFRHESYQVHISNGSFLGQWESATYMVASRNGNQSDTPRVELSSY